MVGRSQVMAMLMRRPAAMRQLAIATRGGGGGGPDLKPYPMYKYTRRYHLEDINTTIYSDIGPEFYLHLHSIHIKGSKEGWLLIWSYFFMAILPLWCLFAYIQKNFVGTMYQGSVRMCPDHAHRMPKLLHHLKTHHQENYPDLFGRQNA